jgi:hypothetical protein
VQTRPVIQLRHRQLVVVGEEDALGDICHALKASGSDRFGSTAATP